MRLLATSRLQMNGATDDHRHPHGRNKLAQQVPRSHRPPADEPLADASRRARAPTLHVIVAFDGSPGGQGRFGARCAVLADPAISELLVACVFPPESLAGISFDPEPTGSPTRRSRTLRTASAEAVLVKRGRFATRPRRQVSRGGVRVRLHGLQQLALSAGADVLVVGSTRRGRSDGCRIAAWPAASCEIHHARSPSCHTILAIASDPGRPA